jgi:pimeloyl-ACP methyl ester carboxylesterase
LRAPQREANEATPAVPSGRGRAYLPIMPFVTAAGVEVHYVEHGPPDAGRTAVILHGFTTDHRMCVAAFEPAFRGRPGWRRIYPDFPGMGQTRAPEWLGSTDDVLRVTQAAVNALVPGPYALAGASYGGYIAMGLAAAQPDRVIGLALVVPMIVPAHALRDVGERRVLVRDGGLRGSELHEELAVVVTAETLRRNDEEIEAAIAVADQAAAERIGANYGGTFMLADRYERPALVVLGRQDNVLGYNDQWRVMGQWPRATFAVLDRAGHGLTFEQPALLTTLVDDWLDRVAQNDLHLT